MRQTPTNRYVSGDIKRQCDECGWDYLESQLRRRWDGALVCEKDYDPKPDYLKERRMPRPDTPHNYKGDIDADQSTTVTAWTHGGDHDGGGDSYD